MSDTKTSGPEQLTAIELASMAKALEKRLRRALKDQTKRINKGHLVPSSFGEHYARWQGTINKTWRIIAIMDPSVAQTRSEPGIIA